MPKQKSIYICQNCSYESPKWLGQCPDCGEWNTFEESVVSGAGTKGGKNTKFGAYAGAGVASKPIALAEVSTKAYERVSSGIGEFDRVLGGGFVSGQVILLAGDPGIGKSTLLTQIAQSMKGNLVCYVCGEESPHQIKIRAERMNYKADNLLLLNDTQTENIVASISNYAGRDKIGLIIVDSIQTLSTESLTGIAGSVGQVKLSAQMLTNLAKSLNIPVIMVGHVTKEGTVAGPKVLEHLVDTVLHFEGDNQHMYRILKTTKNRFGTVSEVGVFEMNEAGLREITNPSEIFLSEQEQGISGSCVTVIMEGQRPLLFEVQALTTSSNFGYPKRTASGFNANRLQVLIAVLEKRAKVNLSDQDVYINIAGGFKVSEYAGDLAVCLAIVSSLKNKALKPHTAVFGECGLVGEIRRVSNEDKRIKEAKKLGYTNVVSSHEAKFLAEAIRKAF